MWNINTRFPCLEYVGNNLQYRSASEKFATKLFGKIGIGKEDMYVMIAAIPALASGFGIVPEEVGEDFDCGSCAGECFGLDMSIPGNNVCLACSVGCGQRKEALDEEERQFLTYLFMKGPEYGDKVFPVLDETGFGGYSLVSKCTNTTGYPMCVPLASMIYREVRHSNELFNQICESVAALSSDTGKKGGANKSPKINNELVTAVINEIVDFCKNPEISEVLSSGKNRSALWNYMCKQYICCGEPMSDEYAERFIKERTQGTMVVAKKSEKKTPAVKEKPVEENKKKDALASEGEEEVSADKPVNSVSDKDYQKVKEENERLRWEVYHDSLTKVFNAKAYKEKGIVSNHRCAVYADINNLKYVNDVVGTHEAGDRLITVVAEVLEKNFGEVYRVGGDEFIAFTELDESEVKEKIEAVEKDLDSETEKSQEGIVYSVSMGYAFSENEGDILTAVKCAEKHMMEEKKRYKMEHPKFDVRGELKELNDVPAEDVKPQEDEEPKRDEREDFVIEEAAEPQKNDGEDERVFIPSGELESHPYFTKKVDVTEGGYLSAKDNVRRIPMRNRRYVIPFAENDRSCSSDRNVIVHHEITSADIALYDSKGSRRKVFEIKTNSGDVKIETELDVLLSQAMSDKKIACEIAYVTDIEEYVLLLWNASSRRIDYFVLITKKGNKETDGVMRPVPRQVIEIFKKEGIKKVCYQPYLLYAMMGLYVREVEIKNVHSIYSSYFVFNERTGGMVSTYEGVMDSYVVSASEKVVDRLEYMERIFRGCPRFMQMMGVYCEIARMQFDYSDTFGYGALCASRHRKDLMYGYSYLAAGVIPSMQKALFKLTPQGQIVFFNKPEPSISYFEGYMVQYMFRNINSDPGEDGKVREANEKSNIRARQLLLKDLATVGKGFYHTNIKILYFDEYYMVFYMAHNYLVQNQQFIETALKRECTMHKIVTDQFLYSCWAVTFDMVRLVNKH